MGWMALELQVFLRVYSEEARHKNKPSISGKRPDDNMCSFLVSHIDTLGRISYCIRKDQRQGQERWHELDDGTRQIDFPLMRRER